MSQEHTGPEYRAFAHLNADKCSLYRDILRAFTRARSSFTLHLRPSEMQSVLTEEDAKHYPIDEIEAALAQLCEWGNIEAHRDTSDVETVEAFYRPRYLYQLTNAGEAAERAISAFHGALIQPGELQSRALEDIQRHLGELEILADQTPPDQGKVSQVLDLLSLRFESLTSRAQTFMRSLQRQIDLQGVELEVFIAYKEKLIDYLERFIEGLVVATAEVGQRIERIEELGVNRLLVAAAERETSDAIAQTPEMKAEAIILWTRRWAGFRNWFIGRDGRPSQAEVLRARSRSAVPALLAAIAGINERRISRSDRVADLKTLACWFAEAESDSDAHRLWRASFGLTATRHIEVNADTLALRDHEPIASNVSWFDAPCVTLSPRLRKSGRNPAKGPARSIIDRREGKAALAKFAKDEAAQIEAAQVRLATGRRMRLSEIGHVDPSAFALFLDLLGKALGGYLKSDEPVEADSSDGSLHIRMEPTKDDHPACIDTDDGIFHGKDYFVTVTRSYTEAR